MEGNQAFRHSPESWGQEPEMNKSEIFRQAHALARQVIQAGDDYRVTFGAALKSLQSKPAEIVDQLIALGGNLWEKGSMRRVYFNNVPALIGLSYSTYKTGNISSASLNGVGISNSECARILRSIGKIYWDLDTGKMHGSYTEQSMLNQVAAIIRAKLG